MYEFSVNFHLNYHDPGIIIKKDTSAEAYGSPTLNGRTDDERNYK